MDKKTKNKLIKSIIFNSIIVIFGIALLISLKKLNDLLSFQRYDAITIINMLLCILPVTVSVINIFTCIISLCKKKLLINFSSFLRYVVTSLFIIVLIYDLIKLIIFNDMEDNLENFDYLIIILLFSIVVVFPFFFIEKRKDIKLKQIFISGLIPSSCLAVVLIVNYIIEWIYNGFNINQLLYHIIVVFISYVSLLLSNFLVRAINNYYLKVEKRWVKPRHKIIYLLLWPIIALLVKIKYNCKIRKAKDCRQMVVLMNHQTTFDQFLVSLSLRKPVYYIASEDLFSIGFISRVLEYLVAPIPIKKSMTDMVAVKNSLKVAKEGGTICLSPEGNRTYSGKTVNMKKSIVPFIKKLGLPVAIYKIEGGYGVHPRWSDATRKGEMTSGIVKIIEKNEYEKMSNDEFFDLIYNELNINDVENKKKYISDVRAEYLERAYYVCPNCGLSTFFSQGNKVSCVKCKIEATYTEDRKFISDNFPFKDTVEWMDYQEKYIRNLDLSTLNDVIYYDEISFSEVIPYKHKKEINKHSSLSLYNNKVLIKDKEEMFIINFDDVHAMACLGRNKLNIYYKDKIYQVKGDKRFNPVKYMNIYYHYINNLKEEKGENDEFLGL